MATLGLGTAAPNLAAVEWRNFSRAEPPKASCETHARCASAERAGVAARNKVRGVSNRRPQDQRSRTSLVTLREYLTARFPAIREPVAGLEVDRALVDGEAILMRDDGYCDFVNAARVAHGAGYAACRV
jgi:hypothetical protein